MQMIFIHFVLIELFLDVFNIELLLLLGVLIAVHTFSTIPCGYDKQRSPDGCRSYPWYLMLLT